MRMTLRSPNERLRRFIMELTREELEKIAEYVKEHYGAAVIEEARGGISKKLMRTVNTIHTLYCTKNHAEGGDCDFYLETGNTDIKVWIEKVQCIMTSLDIDEETLAAAVEFARDIQRILFTAYEVNPGLLPVITSLMAESDYVRNPER